MEAGFWNTGLHFSCMRCSSCCRHDPGFVFLSKDDISRLITVTGFAFSDFMAKFIRPVDIGTGFMLSLKEKKNNDCIFWGKSGCEAYSARPLQCSSYPFWPNILINEGSWKTESEDCPGIKSDTIVSAEAISAFLIARRLHPALVLTYDTEWEHLNEDAILGSSRLDTHATDSGEAQE